jgi:hypothetical protein
MTFEKVLPDETEELCAAVPCAVLVSLRRYATEHVPTGGFLRHVLANDLQGAVARADEANMANLRGILEYVYNAMPSTCWGTWEKVTAWTQE